MIVHPMLNGILWVKYTLKPIHAQEEITLTYSSDFFGQNNDKYQYKTCELFKCGMFKEFKF